MSGVALLLSTLPALTASEYTYVTVVTWDRRSAQRKESALGHLASDSLRQSERITALLNFMCQLDGAMVPRYLVKHYFGCFCKGVLEEIYI